jgi:enterochelin esterase-like enzyme
MEQVSRRNAIGLSAVGLLAATASGVEAASAQDQPTSQSATTPMDPRQALVEAAKANSPQLVGMIDSVMPQIKANGGAVAFLRDKPPLVAGSALGAAAWGPPPTQGSAVVWHDDFLFVMQSDQPATMTLDGQAEQSMQRVADTNYWFRLETNLRPGATHRYTYFSGGQNVGTNDVAVYTPLSYPIAGAPQGTLSDERTITSRIYGGAQAKYWIYVNAGVDTARGAPIMVWQDGPRHLGANDANGTRLKTVTDNLVHLKRIPPMVHLLIAPGTGGETRPLRYKDEPQDNVMRSLQYDSVSGRYGDYILQEVLPEVQKSVKLREDGYSRGAGGLSSGGICSFSLAWFKPDQFSRVHSTIGTFTGMQWYPEQHIDGGYILSNRVRRDEKRNIRVWMSDGMNDIEVGPDGRADLYVAGSWPLNNLQMANALKTRGYDFHFRFGTAGHSEAQEAMDLPEALTWLWRDYDPEKTSQIFEQEEAERKKPIFRVQVANRDAW